MDHFLQLLISNAPGWIGMVILAYIMLKLIEKLDGDDDDED